MVKCANCGSDAVVRLHYNKTDLCGGCFCGQFENRVRQANRDFGLIKMDQRIAVGISGGKDSAAMLYVLSKIVKNVHGTELVPILIDEGIAGYRDRAIRQAQALCGKLGLELRTFSYKDGFGLSMDEIMRLKRDMPEKRFERSCTYCGVFRKSLLNKAALQLQADALAIGHNADDIAQTFLMNMLHNEPERLKRMDVINDETEGFVPRIKPMIYNPEKEVALYCELKGLPYFRGECPYANESFRGEIKDFLNGLEMKFPGIKFNLLRSYLAMRGELRKAKEFDRMFPEIGDGKRAGKMGGGDMGKEIAAVITGNSPAENSGMVLMGGQPENRKMADGEKSPADKIFRCSRCGQNSSAETCKACAFAVNLSGVNFG